MKKAQPPKINYAKATVRPIKFEAPRPIPKLKKSQIKVRPNVSFSLRHDIAMYNPYIKNLS